MRNYVIAGFMAAMALTGFQTQASTNLFATQGLQKSYNWQEEWGGINFGGVDPGIPSADLQPKADIKRIVSQDGTQTSNLSGIKADSVDLNSDGIMDIITDGSAYFKKYQKAGAPVTVCTAADGCYISVYLFGENTSITSAPSSDSGSPNITTKYNTRTIYSEQVLGWNVIAAADFETWATGKDYQLFNANPVFAAHRNNTKCYQDEIAQNNNQCIKYSQYVGNFATGAFMDLYNYQDSLTQPQYDTRFTYIPYDRSAAVEARGIVNGDGFGHKLASGGIIDIQIANMAYYHPNGQADARAFHSYEITNSGKVSLFVPANSDKEFSSFINAATSSHLSGVSVCTPPVQFTDWGGDQQCPTISTTTTTIAAQRFCVSATSDYRPCSECVAAAKKAKGVGYPDDWAKGCSKTQECEANACYIDSSTATSPQFPRSLYWNTYTSAAECEAERDTLWAGFSNGTASPDGTMPNKLPANWLNGWPTQADLGTYPHNFWIIDYYFAIQANGLGTLSKDPFSVADCTAAMSALCSMGHICLAGDSMITLPDGTTQRIDAVKVGDTVLGFATTQGKLTPFKVTKLATTPKQDLLKINGTLSVTPNHRVIVAGGKELRASQLKVGDVLLAGDRSRVTIKAVETVPAQDTVYNLVLDKPAIGFVADGIRVTDYKQ